MTLDDMVMACIQAQASDLHLSAGQVPMIRVDGQLRPLPSPPLSAAQITDALTTLLGAEATARLAVDTTEWDGTRAIGDSGRFRIHVFRQHRGLSLALRPVPSRIPSLADIEAPARLAELALRPRGLVLVTGPTGSGKSTTLAAMVDHVNRHRHGHIITLEDPIEYLHPSRHCLVQQREIGPMSRSFAQALRAALRQDPDLILVGEMRDPETIRLALTAAETGHLVLSTLHTSSAARTISRIIDVFPAAEKDLVRAMLAESLEAVVSQLLLPGASGAGRVAVHEILLATPAIRHQIREHRIDQMYSVMQTGQAQGMQTLDHSLAQRLRQGRISLATAREQARYPEQLPH